MDWLTFTSTMTGHIMWPLVIVVLLFLLRSHIGALAERIEEFSFGGATFTWKKKLEEGAKIIEHAPLPELPKPAEPELPLKMPAERPMGELAARDATTKVKDRQNLLREFNKGKAVYQVILGLDEIDKLAFEIGDWYGIDAASAFAAIRMLVAIDVLPETSAKLYETLRDARNALMHNRVLPKESEITEYSRQINFLKASLEKLRDAAKVLGKRERPDRK